MPQLITPNSPSKANVLEIGQWPEGDDAWRNCIAMIRLNLKGIMEICNQQSGPKAKEALNYEDSLLMWYAMLADYMMRVKPVKKLHA